MCDFQKLSFNEHGYIVRCNECSHYQLGFGTAMLTLSQADFRAFAELIEEKIFSVTENDITIHEEIKSVVIPTPYTGMCLVLTKTELQHLYTMLDNAENEIKALSLLELFRH